MTQPERAGRSTFTIEGRAAPGLFVVGWLATLLGLGGVLVGFLSAGTAAGAIVFVIGLAILDVGLVAGAGGQAIERRARGVEPYAGPSPLLLLLVAIATVYLVAIVVFLLLSALGIAPWPPLSELLVVAIHAAVYLAVARLLVVGTGALSWTEMGFRGPLRRALSEIAWGAVVAGPILLVTLVLGSLLIAIFRATPPSPLPPTGSLLGLLVNLIAGAVIAPLGEEVMFRGVATTAWVRSLGERVGIVRGALLFALVHVLLVGADTFNQAAGLAAVEFVGRIPVALMLGWVYVRRGTIWAPLGLHAMYNAILLILAELAPSAS